MSGGKNYLKWRFSSLDVKIDSLQNYLYMDNNLFLSYIVPCFNIEQQLPRCIESLERQNVDDHDLEFILVNDGSTDGTLQIIKKFAERDPRVVVIDQDNQGVCAARNNALKVVKGEYVFFLDGDDYLTDDASQKMYETCKDTLPDILLLNNYKVWEGAPDSAEMWIDYSRLIEEGTYQRIDFLEKTKRIPVSFKLYKLKLLKSNNIMFDQQLKVGEVYTFFIHALSMSDTVGVSYTPVMYYLKRKGGSATTIINVERDMSVLDTLHTINSYVDKYAPELRDKRSFLSSLFFMITAFYLIKYVSRTEYTSQIGELIRRVKKDKAYHKLLVYFTGKGFTKDHNTLLASAIRFLPVRFAYLLIRYYYRLATRNIRFKL